MKQKKITVEKLFDLLKITDLQSLKQCSKNAGLSAETLKYYNDNMLIPTGNDMRLLSSYLSCSEEEVELKLGYISPEIQSWINKNSREILKQVKMNHIETKEVVPVYQSQYGQLYNDDCLNVLKAIEDDSVDMVFADPPFNLNKDYGEDIKDDVSKSEYIQWCELWIKECVRVLKPGGALFIYNLPYWNTFISNILNRYLNFRHWIAVSMKGLIPVQGKIQPEHYSLLYYIKGEKPQVFNKQRIPLVTCRHCGGEMRDYGGKKSGLSPEGISISDIFMDLNPVRHKKYKNREANELPLKLLDRIILLSTNEGDTVFDPFGGSGTTYISAELLKRKWIGVEIGDTDVIINRLRNNERDIELFNKIRKETNMLFTAEQVKLRQKNNFWTYERLDVQPSNLPE